MWLCSRMWIKSIGGQGSLKAIIFSSRFPHPSFLPSCKHYPISPQSCTDFYAFHNKRFGAIPVFKVQSSKFKVQTPSPIPTTLRDRNWAPHIDTSAPTCFFLVGCSRPRRHTTHPRSFLNQYSFKEISQLLFFFKIIIIEMGKTLMIRDKFKLKIFIL
jgi:hypothetical protein